MCGRVEKGAVGHVSSYQGRKAKRTKYGKVWFRSRLESRWAEWFDQQDIPWKYEPTSFGIDTARHYTPDFAIQVPEIGAVLCEVKPTWKQAVEDARLQRLAQIIGNPCLALSGDPLFTVHPGGKKYEVQFVEVFLITPQGVEAIWNPGFGKLIVWLHFLNQTGLLGDRD